MSWVEGLHAAPAATQDADDVSNADRELACCMLRTMSLAGSGLRSGLSTVREAAGLTTAGKWIGAPHLVLCCDGVYGPCDEHADCQSKHFRPHACQLTGPVMGPSVVLGSLQQVDERLKVKLGAPRV